MALANDFDTASRLMKAFLGRTGLTSSEPVKRYLWTDAFAVCNLIAIARKRSEPAEARLATQLVDQVHHTLGRFRPGDPRKGWLSGLSEDEGEKHPTIAGLRIGKPLPERGPDEPYDTALEWERDGQYFHYLTKWMLALNGLAQYTGEARYNTWARELASTAERAFSYRANDGQTRMHWKMSVDLSHPLVASMGQHDPLDGYVTYLELVRTAATLKGAPQGPHLKTEIAAFWSMLRAQDLATDDPLGLGELLLSAERVKRLEREGVHIEAKFFERLVDAAGRGLELYVGEEPFERPATDRLAFRELGLAIGLRAVGRGGFDDPSRALQSYLPLVRRITRFWLDKAHQTASSWTDHQDINEVMLATALLPPGC